MTDHWHAEHHTDLQHLKALVCIQAQLAAMIAADAIVTPQRRRGRPPGTGTYASGEDFLQTVRPLIQRLRREGVHPSQAKVAEQLPSSISVRQLQRWGEMYHLTWADVLKRA